MGRSFRVVPAVLVRSQVLRNNLGYALLPAADLTREWADAWNGVPVLLGPHPKERGLPVSGRSPSEWNARNVGWIFNAHVKPCARDGTPRVVGDVWLDESRAEDVPGFADLLARVNAGQVIELSTGFPTQVEPSAGELNGQHYDLVMHPLGADHLVISLELSGACSVTDGCGLGANAALDH